METEPEAEAATTAPAPEDRDVPSADTWANLAEMSMPDTGIVTPLLPGSAEEERPAPQQPIRQPRREPLPPAKTFSIGDRIFNVLTGGFAALILVILATILVILL